MALFAMGCNKDNTCGVPHGDGGVVDLSLPEMSDLTHVGGYVVINRGHKGIFVVRTSMDGEFLAFECACPNDPDVAVAPQEGFESAVLQCPKWQTIFSVYADAAPIDGNQTPCSLYQYGATLSADGYTLVIY
ncbi:MAG: hypothetical protein KBT04_05550 [Bacteroidales bacterium]|nr:hypothetical protein [Candidatus Colimorpha onthohippi]